MSSFQVHFQNPEVDPVSKKIVCYDEHTIDLRVSEVKPHLVNTAIRMENYSDFMGVTYKVISKP